MGFFFKDKFDLCDRIKLASLLIMRLYYQTGGYNFEKNIQSFESQLILKDLYKKYEFTEAEIEALLHWIKIKDGVAIPTLSGDLSFVTVYEIEEFIKADLASGQEGPVKIIFS